MTRGEDMRGRAGEPEGRDFGDGPGNTIGRGTEDVGGMDEEPGAVAEGEADVEAGADDGPAAGGRQGPDPAAVRARSGDSRVGSGEGDLGGGGDLGSDLNVGRGEE